MSDELKTTVQAAEYLRVKAKTLHNWRSQGRGPAFVKVGSLVFYPARDLQAYLERNRHEPSAA
jgi:excisionase family DNA binding protein